MIAMDKQETFKDMVIGALVALLIIVSVFCGKLIYDNNQYITALEVRNQNQFETIQNLEATNDLVIPYWLPDDL